ncbi:MAG: hypothetical protein EAZ89_16090 [Bacteroidetes bacterium]|nr:MAG: hypothetical protein EAZ89_16090 [Bacteroidota bacterium]
MPLTLFRPFSPRSSDTGADDYYRHRQAQGFLYELNQGIRQVADEHAEKLIEAGQKMTDQIDTTLKEGFEEVNDYQREIHHALIDQTQVIYRGFEGLNVRLDTGFDRVSLGLSEVANRVDQTSMAVVESGERLFKGIAGLKSALDMGMAGIVSQFELERAELKAGFEQLADLLENSRKTEARERFRDGKTAYEQYLRHPEEGQFLADALEYLNQSVQIYRGNPYAHLYMGHIRQEAASFYDLFAAREHYLLCATYAKGLNNPSLAALGYFMGAWLSYVLGEFDESIRLGELSREYDPEGLPENWFNLARTYARLSKSSLAIERLDRAIRRFDPLYALKAELDEDFRSIQPELNRYFVQIRDEAARDWQEKLKKWELF